MAMCVAPGRDRLVDRRARIPRLSRFGREKGTVGGGNAEIKEKRQDTGGQVAAEEMEFKRETEEERTRAGGGVG
jgi:hypothetical protein